MIDDIFGGRFEDDLRERAGVVLSKKDMKKDRKAKIKTDAEIFADFQHNLHHPFLAVIMADARECVIQQKAFVLHKRIAVLTENKNSDASYLYYNEGDTWRASGNALISKYLHEFFPDLDMPRLKIGVKGVQLLLDAYPEHFDDLREELKVRALAGDDEEEDDNE